MPLSTNQLALTAYDNGHGRGLGFESPRAYHIFPRTYLHPAFWVHAD
jgi:hypothetical protein